jgi:hypothetical protein
MRSFCTVLKPTFAELLRSCSLLVFVSYLAIGSDTPRAEAVAGVAALHHRGGPFGGRVDRAMTHPPRRLLPNGISKAVSFLLLGSGHISTANRRASKNHRQLPFRSGPWRAWIKVKNPKALAATRAIDQTF